MAELGTAIVKDNETKMLRNLLFVMAIFSCASPSPPSLPPPNPTASSISKDAQDGRSDDNDSEEDPDKTDQLDSNKITPVKPSIGGADIGDDALKRVVRICNTSGFYYDRYLAKGSCTSFALAQVKCTPEGLKKLLSPNQQKTFGESIKTTYKDWKVDQCIDCPPKNKIRLCKSKEGSPQEGTKIFFVKAVLDATGVQGKSMLLPGRPESEDKN